MNEQSCFLPSHCIGNIPPQIIDAVVMQSSAVAMNDAQIGVGSDKVIDKAHRNTTVGFLPKNYWFCEMLFQFGQSANINCGWDYDIQGFENVQWAKYGPDQHYTWHVDTFHLSRSQISRKITVVCLLSEPSEFEGGQFEMGGGENESIPLVKGSLLAFPSVLSHRVTPVINGVRQSATMWITGPKFK